ncbi:hypothetical protein [Streptomyces lomondensis]|uniref:Uncharacterized protein n=1 Tax=Streptomyces lomondensis TaxID=68229 RepID=A0ABQ2XSE3_9ACTN|nr:hypothetical protein [Streptomyces lomondensis]MCF0083138.1 hypothetical protein [Streptomyces lomondensis]GGX31402.1 hypothetical protein GCM10010383_72210 [Streptomyces lomondensis]
MVLLVLLGELCTDGSLRTDHGPAVRSSVNAAFRNGYFMAVVPDENSQDAWQRIGVAVHGARHLRQVVALLSGEPVPHA